MLSDSLLKSENEKDGTAIKISGINNKCVSLNINHLAYTPAESSAKIDLFKSYFNFGIKKLVF